MEQVISWMIGSQVFMFVMSACAVIIGFIIVALMDSGGDYNGRS